MAATDTPAKASGLMAHLGQSVTELRQGKGARFVRRVGSAMAWQAVGKLLQFVGAIYALRCLGPASVGLSGTVLVAAMFGQLVLDFGLEIVSVRHVAAGTMTLARVTSAVCTLRALASVVATLAWFGVMAFLPMSREARWVWGIGACHLLFLAMNYSWFFQATDRMPVFSFVQNAATVLTSVYFLLCFRPGEPVGNDLWVTMVFNGLATMLVYWYLHRRLGMQLIDRDGFRAAWELFREGRPTWTFNLIYFAMANMGLPLVNWLLGEAGNREAGYYRSSMVLVAACQAFLSYFALMLNPRIVRWRQEDPQAFRRRLTVLTAALCAMAVLGFCLTWLLREPVFVLLGKAYQPGARILPALVAGKFLALASGFLVWGLFACQRDWLAVGCCAVPLAASLGLHVWLVPRWGIDAAGWLNLGSEALLLALGWMAFRRHAWGEVARA